MLVGRFLVGFALVLCAVGLCFSVSSILSILGGGFRRFLMVLSTYLP